MRTHALETSKVVAIAGLLLAGLLMSAGFLEIARGDRVFPDMLHEFNNIQDWLRGTAPLYASTEATNLWAGSPALKFPPFWVVTVLPLIATLPIRTAVEVYAAMSVIGLLAGLILLLRHLGVSWLSPRFASVMLTLALLGPLYESFFGTTNELAILGLIAAVFVLSERKMALLGGMVLAVAILFKIYPVFFAFYFLLRRDFRLLASTACWLVVFSLAPMLVLGYQEVLRYHFQILPQLGAPAGDAQNASAEFLLMNVWRFDWFHHGVTPMLQWPMQQELFYFNRVLALAGRIVILSVFVVSALLLQRQNLMRRSLDRLQLFGMWIAAVLVCIPVAWVNYQLLLMIPFSGLILWLGRGRIAPLRWAAMALMAISFLSMTTPVNYVLVTRLADPSMRLRYILATSIGGELETELHARVVHRSWQLAAIDLDEEELGGASRREIRRALRDRGVHGVDRVGPERQEARLRVAALREAYAKNPTPAQDRALRHEEARLRRSSLTTRQVFGLVTLRSLVGLLAFVGAALTCWAPAVETRAGTERARA